MKGTSARPGTAATLLAVAAAASMGASAAIPYTREFPIENCNFKASGSNPYFRLTPGRQAYFSNQRCVAAGDCDELEELWITVTDRTRQIELLDVGIAGGGDQGNRTRVWARLEISRHLVTRSSRKLEIHDDHVRLLANRFGERALTVRGSEHRESFGAQVYAPHVERVGVVVDDQEAWTWRHVWDRMRM